jgi:plastocyanin
MKNHNFFLRNFLGAVATTFFIIVSNAVAVTHIIQFGGSFGLTYSPNNLTCSVGDSIKWTGDFSIHPLSSTTIPAGVASWHHGSGSSFVYAVTVPGKFNYQCDNHVGSGMIGSFTATSTAVENARPFAQPGSFVLDQNYPNPFNPITTIGFGIPEPQHVRLTVYNILGEETAVLVDGQRSAGSYSVHFDGSALPSGFYYYKLETERFNAVKRFTLLK